jgi:Questin oxidase-like
MYLDEAYERMHRYGPEFGGDEEGNHGMTNHGPMAVEVMLHRGLDVDVTRWVDRYVGRLVELPEPSRPIEEDWTRALGDHLRLPDWRVFFAAQLAEHSWPDVLGTWWPRLLPGIAAGSTHGVIRVGHAVRALRAGSAAPARDELAHGLAFWAARYLPLPSARPHGTLPAAVALDRVVRLADQTGFIAHRAARLATTAGWTDSVAAMRPVEATQAPAALAELMAAAVRGYLCHGPAAPVLLVHTATAPNAVRHVLPSLPGSVWAESVRHVWTAVAAIQAMYAPARGTPRRTSAPHGADAAADALHRAVGHGDEHVIKFTDTAVDAFDSCGDPGLLTAARLARELIPRP